MKSGVCVLVFCCLYWQPLLAQSSPSLTPLPFDFPVFIEPMSRGLDGAIRKELEAMHVFRQIADRREEARLIMKMIENGIAFALPDGSRYGNWTIPLNDETLREAQKGKTKDVAKRLAEVVRANVDPWMYRNERELLAEFGRPHTLIPAVDGGKDPHLD